MSRTSLLDTEYIWNILKQGKYSKIDKLLARILQVQWYHSIIETHKLLDNHGAYSLEKIRNLILNNHSRLNWKNTQSINEIKKHFDEFYKDKRVKAVTKEIKVARDKHYAHSDLNLTTFKVTLIEIKYLLEKTFGLINFITENLFGYKQCFDLSESDLQHIISK